MKERRGEQGAGRKEHRVRRMENLKRIKRRIEEGILESQEKWMEERNRIVVMYY